MFKPNRLIQECIENSDVRGLKGAFVGIIFSDRSFSSGDFDNTLSYVKNKTNINIMERFDSGELLSNKINSGKVTEDDFGEAVYNLKINFCEERIKDVKKLAKVLYGKNNTIQTNGRAGQSQGKKQQCHQKVKNQNHSSNGTLIVAGVVTVAAIAIAAGLIIKMME